MKRASESSEENCGKQARSPEYDNIIYNPDGPFEEFGSDSSDSDVSQSDSESESDDEEAKSLPRALLGSQNFPYRYKLFSNHNYIQMQNLQNFRSNLEFQI